MQIITAAVIKGGTGKTSTAAAIAQAAVKAGKKTLAIDLDPQGNLTAYLGADPNEPGSYELLTGENPQDIIQPTEQGVYAIAASQDLATIRTRAGSARRLSEAIAPIKEIFDLIIIDTPPQMGELLFNALQASTGLIIPLEADTSALQGLYQLTDIVNQMHSSNPALEIKGVIITRFDSRPKLNRFLRDSIAERAAELNAPYLGEIRNGIAIREAQAMGQSLFDYAPGSKPAEDYTELYNKIMEG